MEARHDLLHKSVLVEVHASQVQSAYVGRTHFVVEVVVVARERCDVRIVVVVVVQFVH